MRTFNPKQLKYEDKSDTKFKFATFNKNVNRVKAATAGFDPELAIRELKYDNLIHLRALLISFVKGYFKLGEQVEECWGLCWIFAWSLVL